ncbi:MAG TPA: signal peptide peptidase SppA [Kofleriaceae bacterium]|nr:signal peptide peptidase SppA [Kofleriaceae bacterium]
MRALGTRAALLVSGWIALAPRSAAAQPDPQPRYAEEPTAGMNLPTTGLAGEHDALAVAANPAGLQLMDGWQLALAVDGIGVTDEDTTTPGKGVGLFAAGSFFGGLLPKVGWGLGLELLSPSRIALAPDPGTPARFTLAHSVALGRMSAFGFAWRHFFDEVDAPMRGVDTFDLGLSTRLNAYAAFGLAVRDVGQPTVAGVPVERRYEAEVAARPTGDDRVELALGGRVGEVRTDFTNGADMDAWFRGSLRIFRGIYLKAQVDSRSLFQLAAGPATLETDAREVRELRVTGGLEISLGGVGAAGYAGAAFDQDKDGRFAGSTLVLRASQVDVPSVFSPDTRIERIELRGGLGERELTRLVAYLRRVKKDDAVAAVLVQIQDMEAGWAATDELRRALHDVRAAGKPVFTYMLTGTTRDYFLASVSNRIYVDPAGGLRLTGMVATSLYFRGLFDKLGVFPQFLKIEEYKSAPEQWTNTGPTEPASTARNELYDSLFEYAVEKMATSRRIDEARMRVLIDNGPYTAGELEKIPDLVDAVVDPDGLAFEIRKELGGHLYPVGRAPLERDERWEYPGIAVIYIDGDIVDGPSSTIPLLGMQLVGAETIGQTIAAARASSEVDAIVLRINSPGGSAVASDLLAREIFKTRGVKPLICSLGDVAASGGYFVAAGCDTILADPMTITGSIGIYNGKFDFSGLLAKLGISAFTYKRGEGADMESWVRPFTDAEYAFLKRKLHYFYGRFLRVVADGRGMTTEQVDAIGRGRVWTGIQARPIRLIDRFGGIGDAILLAKRRAGLGDDDEARILMLPGTSVGLLSRLLGGIVRSQADDKAAAERSFLEVLLPRGVDRVLLKAIPGSIWHQPNAVQARLPFSILIE